MPTARRTARAPAEDKAEIAARLGWLAKETGNTGAANRYFARSRGSGGIGVAHVVLAITAIVSFLAFSSPDLFETPGDDPRRRAARRALPPRHA